MELAVIGNSNFITGFRLAGIRKIYDIENISIENSVRKILEEDDVGILIMNNNDFNSLPDSLKKLLNESIKTTLITLGNSNSGTTNLRQKIKQAVGVDLWK